MPQKKDYTEADLNRQAIAAKSLIAAYGEVGEDADDELNHDLVEGETTFFEAAEKALEQIVDCGITAEGCDAMIKKLTARKDRANKRAATLKGAIDQAFQLAEIPTHKFAIATVSSRKVPPKLVVTDESKIPSSYFKTPAPALDRKKLTDDLKALAKPPEGDVVEDKPKDIPGASLSNGGQTIAIRWV